MLWVLVRKELLDQVLRLRFGLMCVLCPVVILAGVGVMTENYGMALADYRANAAMHEREILKNRSFGVEGLRVEKPVEPLRIFVQGIDRAMGGTALVSSWFRYEPHLEPAYGGNPIPFLFPAFDLVFVIGTVMSLVAIAFSYDAVSGEKEQATLRLLMSFSVPRDRVLLAKWMGGYLAMAGPLLVSLLGGLALVAVWPDVVLSEADWLAVGLVMLTGFVYLSGVYSLGLWVSTRTRMASTSILLLLLIWVLMVLVGPNLAPYVAVQVRSIPSAYAVEKAKHQVQIEERKAYAEALNAWQAGSPDAPRKERNRKRSELEDFHYRRIADRKRQISDGFQREMGDQVRLAQGLSRISPLASFVYAVSGLAGSGVEEQFRFQNALLDYQREIQRFVYAAHERKAKTGTLEISGYPRLVFKAAPLSDRIAGAVTDLLLLGMWNVVFFAGAYVGFLKYDVR